MFLMALVLYFFEVVVQKWPSPQGGGFWRTISLLLLVDNFRTRDGDMERQNNE